MKEISPTELKARLDKGEDVMIVDLREDYETDSGTITDLHIPLADLKSRCAEIRRQGPVVLCCRSGKRSAAAVRALEVDEHYDNLYYLCGGLEAWANEIDPNLDVY